MLPELIRMIQDCPSLENHVPRSLPRPLTYLPIQVSRIPKHHSATIEIAEHHRTFPINV
jgi:hypothetical protein